MINENTIFIIVISLGIMVGVFITGIIFFVVYEHYLKKQEQDYETDIDDLIEEIEELQQHIEETNTNLIQSYKIILDFYRKMSYELETQRQKAKSPEASTRLSGLCLYCDSLADQYDLEFLKEVLKHC